MTPEQTATLDRLDLEGVPRLHLSELLDTIARTDADTRRALLVAVDELIIEPTPEDEAAIAARKEWVEIDAALSKLAAQVDPDEPDDADLEAASVLLDSVAVMVEARRAERQEAAAEARRAERVAARVEARKNPPARNGTKEAWVTHAGILGVDLDGTETRDEIIAKVDAANE